MEPHLRLLLRSCRPMPSQAGDRLRPGGPRGGLLPERRRPGQGAHRPVRGVIRRSTSGDQDGRPAHIGREQGGDAAQQGRRADSSPRPLRSSRGAASSQRKSGLDPRSRPRPAARCWSAPSDDSCFMGARLDRGTGQASRAVGSEAASDFARNYASGACVDPHLADMLAPLLFLADGAVDASHLGISGHLRTSLHVAKQFVDAEYTSETRTTARAPDIHQPLRSKIANKVPGAAGLGD